MGLKTLLERKTTVEKVRKLLKPEESCILLTDRGFTLLTPSKYGSNDAMPYGVVLLGIVASKLEDQKWCKRLYKNFEKTLQEQDEIQ